MKAGTYPAWQLLPGDTLTGGVTVMDCVSIGDGLVRLALRSAGSEETYFSQVARDQPFKANEKGG